MINTINMQQMRYINLFERVCNVSTRHCFLYNNMIVFAVPKSKVSLAVGKNGVNMKRLGEILRKRIKVISFSEDENDLSKFIAEVIEPVSFNKVELKGNEIIISAGRQNKAALIGRNHQREKELEDILKNLFKIGKLRIT